MYIVNLCFLMEILSFGSRCKPKVTQQPMIGSPASTVPATGMLEAFRKSIKPLYV